MKRIITLAAILCVTMITAFTAVANTPVVWATTLSENANGAPELKITATIAPGYHLYAPSNPPGGATPLTFQFLDMKGVSTVGEPKADKKYTVEYSDIFMSNEHFFGGKVTFTQKLKATEPDFSFSLEIKGQTCIDGACMPVFYSDNFKGHAKTVDTAAQEALPLSSGDNSDIVNSDSNVNAPLVAVDTSAINSESRSGWWKNVEQEFKAFSNNPHHQEMNLLFILIAGFAGGLLALLTPCVWPMIPMTVSYFLKGSGTSRRRQIGNALLYGGAIITIYVGLGLLITAIFGASALNMLATSAVFNIIFFIILAVFAISFMGGFEITLPASWSNKADSRMNTTSGAISIFFMAFTLVLVSFSCTGPIIGTLLVEAASSGNFLSPAVGMTGFAVALSLPFTLFALFPSWLKAMPKSGGWLNSVKVVLGFLELALAMKFLSVADMAYGWRILDREVFIAIWIVLFTLLGIYLLGKLRFSHDTAVDRIGVGRFLLACVSFSFAVYMLPGLWGAPLKSISAFTPPASTQDFSLYDGEVHPQTHDFEEAMEIASRQGKPVLLDFSGYGCVNCRKMEASVWTDPKIKEAIDHDFVLVTLMVDDKQPLAIPMQVTEKDGKVRTLRTVGDKWSYLQRIKFGANAQPYHVILDSDGNPLAAPYTYNDNPEAYLKWLKAIQN